jgi:glyoxylase-like metal-dependent hydrolase (beta-lactamase superfamily II)
VRAVSLHQDVIVVTSAVLQLNCVIVRGAFGEADERDSTPSPASQPATWEGTRETGAPEAPGETFVIDSPALPDELDALPRLIEQAGFPLPSGLLATHADWDHVLGRLAFPELALGCAESTAERLRARPGEPQRGLRAFDEDLMLARPRPLGLGAFQGLPVPGRCELGDGQLELHQTAGHTMDGMAIAIPWAQVLVVGDYLSAVELPTLDERGDHEAYVETLERLRALLASTEQVVPGHGPILDRARAGELLAEDLEYVRALTQHGAAVALPAGRDGAAQRHLHEQNVARISH